MKISKFLIVAFLGVIFLSACSNDDDNFIQPEELQGNFDNGFFVLNEGGGGATGSVSFVNSELDSVQQNVYKTTNDGDDVGNFPQSIFFNGDKAYIISNGSNLITIVNRYTFELIGKIDSGLEVPRYGIVKNGKAYVTNQAGLGGDDDDYLAVINLETNEVVDTVLIGYTAETLEENNGNIYIQGAAYGNGNHIVVYSITNNEIENVIETKEGLNSFDIENNILYAMSTTAIQKINLNMEDPTATTAFSFNYTNTPQNFQTKENAMYYTVSNKVYTAGLGATNAPQDPIVTYESESPDYAFMYGFAVENARVYIADGGDFASDSFIKVFDLNGDEIAKLPVGIAPNGFYFNN